MKDLFVLTADMDALVVMKSILNRPQALGIKPIVYEVDRHIMRDSGVANTGPELIRNRKDRYRKVLLLLDYHGCGWDSRYTSFECMEQIQSKLDTFTWKDNSATVLIVPELEEWLWHNPSSLCRYYRIAKTELETWMIEFARKNKTTEDIVKRDSPKELFEFICLQKLRRTISPRDFERIAQLASIKDWQSSTSFAAIVRILQDWFPA